MDLSKTIARATRPLLAEGDIVQMIFEDHKPLKELIKIMKSNRPVDERTDAFEEFAVHLTAHAKPEEDVLYTQMKNNKDLREIAFEGDAEHGLADQMVEEIKRATDPDVKGAKIKVLAELVEHHIQEEESDLLPAFQNASSDEERLRLGADFLKAKGEMFAMGGDDAPKESSLSNDDLH